MFGLIHRLATALMLVAVAPAFAQAQRAAEPLPPPENGIASVYSGDLEGQVTASGRRYDSNRLTAAHRTLPFGTRVRVTDPASGKTVRVTVIDRWGGGGGRVINLSRAAAEELGIGTFGQLTVRIEVERLGDGEVEEPEDSSVVREPLAPRLESTANDSTGRHAQCSNEAEILGLRDQWRDLHMRNCMARKPAPGGR
jgi:rare lipoprotein A